MKILLFLISLLSVNFSWCQTTIYLGNQIIPSNKIYEIKNGEVNKFSSGIFPEPVFYFDENQVYSDRFKTKCLYTFQDGNIYRGNGTSSFDLIYQLRQGRLLLKTGDIFDKCIYYFSENQVFIGDSKSAFDVIFTFESDVNQPLQLFVLAILIGPI